MLETRGNEKTIARGCLPRCRNEHALRLRANLVVYLVHWGVENSEKITDEQRELACWLIDHAVDLVVGSHPHCVQALDFYHGCPIAYSLGNLVFDGAPRSSRGIAVRYFKSV